MLADVRSKFVQTVGKERERINGSKPRSMFIKPEQMRANRR